MSMNHEKSFPRIAGWIVFGIAAFVYFMTAERTGSLWDCGEFVLGAYKLQVVHPPGAPLFLLVGRIFTWFAEILSNDPQDIAFAVNLMSGFCTAFAAAFVAWSTSVFARLALVGRDQPMSKEQSIVAAAAGLAAGLATTFSTSIWFSAVEGEVYAMSTMFTTLTMWAAVKWYGMEDDPANDRWLVLAIYAAGLSIGVHLLSLLTFPALALLYYFKRYKTWNLTGLLAAIVIGSLMIPVIQKIIIVGIPALWGQMELLMVNGFGFPIHSGVFPTVLIIAAICFFGIRWAQKRNYGLAERLIASLMLLAISFTTIGVVVIRANANPPINMNQPSDAMRLIPYLNREQYGERPLLRGPHYEAQPVDTEKKDRYGIVGDHYEIVDQKISYVYRDEDKIFLPRISHSDGSRPALYRRWMGDENGKPSMAFNLEFMFRYQIGWMYWRYFMWNFAGRQNGEQGTEPWNPRAGHWLSGVNFVDENRLYNMDKLPDTMREHQARNRYFFLPFIFGLIGFLYQFNRRKRDWGALLVLFLFTGLGIIFYSNQPPNEPRERDYVLVGSFFTFCMWIGLAIPAIYEFAKKKAPSLGNLTPYLATALVLLAPAIMCQQNWDDHNRRHHYASRDYANNFLESLEPNAIMFTYGDNDTYPLWYAQEVEGIRTDVRIVNLSLIAVDWYIEGMRRKVNDSEAIKLTIPTEAYRGNKRNQIFWLQGKSSTNPMPLDQVLQFLAKDNPITVQSTTLETFLPTNNIYIPVDPARAIAAGIISPADTGIVTQIPIGGMDKNYITKDQLAVLDVIMSNYYDRPIYFSVTCQESKLMNLGDYTSMEGLGLRIVPIRTPSQREFYIYGSGRVDLDRVYNNVVNKWRWGNFDKKKLFVTDSYGASVQAQKMIIWRTSEKLAEAGRMEEAIKLTDTFFEGFPHMNFPYDARTLPHINVYVKAGALDKAKEHMRILAEETAQQMVFFDSISDEDLRAGFSLEQRLAMNSVSEILRLSKTMEDDAFAQEMESKLGMYNTTPTMN